MALPKIQDLWNMVEKERITGYEHRKPKKRVSAEKKCLISKLVREEVENLFIQPEENEQL
jgi:hypothetical protein